METKKADSRLKNTVRNTSYGIIFKIINIVGAFVSRTLLIYFLGVRYVGLDGLFTSVLSLLSMAELGFNSAIIYKLYKPIANNDTSEVCALLSFYKRIYRIIGVVVCVIGLSILPFLKNFIKGDVPEDVNVYTLFLVYLLNSCLTYWLFAYKTAVLSANQREDLPNKINSITLIIKYIVQISLLVCFRNYYLYVIVLPLTTILSNIGNAYMANKFFPQYVCRGNIDKENAHDIVNKIKALFFNKLGVAIITGSDNIIISSFLGLTILGIYDTYYYIYSMIYSIFAIAHASITPSIGNSMVKESKEANMTLFYRLSFINYWVVSVCAILLFCLYKPFIQLWIGVENSFDDVFSLIMSLFLFFWLYRFVVLIFKNAYGLWWPDRYRALIEAVCNVILNLIMVQYIGIYGIMLSTLLSCVVVSIPWETRVLFSEYFNVSTRRYFKEMVLRFVLLIFMGAICYYICHFIEIWSTLFTIVVKVVICLIITNAILFVVYRNNDNFKYVQGLILSRIRTKK